MAAAMEQTRSSSSEAEEEYEVEKIVGMCESKGETLYKVRWLNYSPSWDTWEPYGNLESCREMMMEYRKKHEKQLAKQKDKKVYEDEEERDSVVGVSGTVRKPKQKKNTFVYVSSDEEEANTLKDRFWHDLEQGKINILDGSDLYSKVKSQGRSARPQSFENMFKDLRRGPTCNGDNGKVHMKRSAPASSGRKCGRPHKVSKNRDTGGKKVTAKVNTGAVMAKTNSENCSLSGPDSDCNEEIDTIKDSFWRDLEDGKINVFGSDLYSKVKGSGRSARPKSFENMFKIRQPRAKKECKESKRIPESQVFPVEGKSQSSTGSPVTATENGNVAADEHLVDGETSPPNSLLTHRAKASDSFSLPADDLEQCQMSSSSDQKVSVSSAEVSVSCNETKACVSSSDLDFSVSSSEPNVNVTYRSNTNVGVICSDPEVIVNSGNIKVSVSCNDSKVSVSCNDSKVSVSCNDSKVSVSCNDSEVSIRSSDPEVTVGSSSVPEVTVRSSSNDPDVTVKSSSDPEVSVRSNDPEVSVRSSDPQVSVRSSDPQVSVRSSDLHVNVGSIDTKVSFRSSVPQVKVRSSDIEVSVMSSDPQVSVMSSDPQVSVRCSDPQVSCVPSEMNVCTGNNVLHPVNPVSSDLPAPEVELSIMHSNIQSTAQLPVPHSNNCVSRAESLTSPVNPVCLSLSMGSASLMEPNSSYSCASIPLVDVSLTNNMLSYSDQQTVASRTHSDNTNVKSCRKQTSVPITEGAIGSCLPPRQVGQTGGMSASLTSLIDLNSRPMENELNCQSVPRDSHELILSSRSRLPVIADSVSTTLSAAYSVKTSMQVEYPNARTCLVENAGSGVSLMEYAVPNMSSINMKSNASVEPTALHMSFPDCSGSGTSVVDWEMEMGSSVFQVNGAVNVASSCQMTAMSGVGHFPEHEALFTPVADYRQNAGVVRSRCMLTEDSLLPLAGQLCVDAVIPPIDYYNAVSSLNKFNMGQPGRTLDAASALDCQRDTAFRSAPTHPMLLQHTRETVANSRTMPPTTGYSSNPAGRMSSMEGNTGIGNLQQQVDGRTYTSGQRLQDVDERLPINIETGLRQEYIPPKQAEKRDEDDMLELNFNIEPISRTTKTSRKKFVASITELTIADILLAVETNDYDTVEWALQNGTFDLNQQNTAGLTLTMIAAKHGYDDILEVLVLHGANVNTVTKTGATALFLSTEVGLRCTVELLLLLGAHVNICTATQETVLTKAIKGGNRNIVKLLLDYGANFGCPHNDSLTSLDYAVACKSLDCLEVLNRHVARLTAEFENQMFVTLNKTAKIVSVIFPMQCFALCEGNKFRVIFHHELQPTRAGAGMLLFIAHTQLTPAKVQCRFYGTSAVTSVTLNGVSLHAVTKESNFVMSFSPLQDRINELVIHTVNSPTSKTKLVVCAYKAQLM